MNAESHPRARRRPARPTVPFGAPRRPAPLNSPARGMRPPEPAWTEPPWIEMARRRLQSLAVSAWPDESLESPNPFSTYAAQRMLAMLAELDLRPDRLLPSLGGGVWMLFSGPGRRADVEIFNHGEIVATFAEDDGTLRFQSLEPSGLRPALTELRGFLQGPGPGSAPRP